MKWEMQFRYGISASSLARWVAFHRIASIQDRRGPDIGRTAAQRIVDAELDAIQRATAKCEEYEIETPKGRG